MGHFEIGDTVVALRNLGRVRWRSGIPKGTVGIVVGIDWLGDEDQMEEFNQLKQGAGYGWPSIIADGKPLETSKGETREFKTLDAAAKLLFKLGIADFAIKLKTTA